MGSAAPSVRRWLSCLLRLAGVGSFVVFQFTDLGSNEDDPEAPALGSADYEQALAGRPPATTVRVDLAPGAVVPTIDGLTGSDQGQGQGQDQDQGHNHDHGGPAPLDPGSATVGAVISTVDGMTSFVVHRSGRRLLAYRVGTDDQWGRWRDLGSTVDEAPDGLPGEEGADAATPANMPVAFDADASRIEFVIIGGDSSAFDLTFIGPADQQGEPNPAGAAIAEGVAAVAGGPNIIPREQWASFEWDYDNESCKSGPGVSDHLAAVVIHHTVTGNGYGDADVPGLLRAIHYSHVVVNGWCDIGYNFVVDRFGRIWEARTGSIDEAIIGGHARGFNTSTMGVALLGQHQPGARPVVADVSPDAEAAVEALAHWKLGIHGVDPAGKTWLRNRAESPPLRLAGGTWHYLPTIVGHRDLGLTSCPGNHGIDLVRALPARLDGRRDVALPYRYGDWRAHGHGPGFVVADALGGVRPAGSASPWSQAPAGLPGGQSAVAVGGGAAGGYLLSNNGAVSPFGSAPPVSPPSVAAGAATVDLVVRNDGSSGWVLESGGILRGFGGTTDLASAGAIDAVAASLSDSGQGYVVDRSGVLHPVGGAPPATTNEALNAGVQAVDVDLRPDVAQGLAGWVLDATGRLHGFGGAPSTRVTPPLAVVAVAADDRSGGGWALDSSGQIWPFGGARLIFPVSTNTSAGHAVDMVNLGSVNSPQFLAGPQAGFVTNAYRLFLGRDPSAAEVDTEAASLDQGRRRSELARGLATSDHWSGATLDQMYADVLGRAPDADGRAYWMGQIADGLALADLGTYFYGSAEYAASSGSTDGYVRGLYRALLGREPDPDGLAYWVGLLQSGQSQPPDVANGFYASIESRRSRAQRLHQRVLAEPPNQDELEYWAERLLAAGDVGVAAELAGSSDFYRRPVDDPGS